MTRKSVAANGGSGINRRTILRGVGATAGAFTVGMPALEGQAAATMPTVLCETELLADQTVGVGSVKVFDNGAIEYTTTSDWVITQIHLHVDESSDPIPTTGGGNPKVGQFEHQESFSPPVNSVTVPSEETGYNGGCEKPIAAHAVVLPVDGQELVTNGGFESPDAGTSQGWNIFDSGTPGLGWTVEWFDGSMNFGGQTRPPTPLLELHRGVNGWSHAEGSQHAELDTDWDGPGGSLNGEPASVKIFQELDTSESPYCQIKYSWSPRPGHDDNGLQVKWGGTVVNTHSADGSGNEDTVWTDEVLVVASPSDLTKLEFIETGAPDSLGMFLDAVSVQCISGDGEETAWGNGESFEGGSWAMKFKCNCDT